MKLQVKPLAIAIVVVTAFSGFQMPQAVAAEKAMSAVDKGKKLAFNKKKGNCIACHQMKGAKLAGTIGPPLVAMKARFPDQGKLRDLIWDMTAKNPHTAMPPFGKHKILKNADIDAIAAYIHTL